jgi:glucosamine--fructose-6-phosphate aminotransferase (isomerizing)
MLREIHEQPKAVGDTLREEFKHARTVLQELDASKITMVYFTGSGTSYHACLAANYALSALTRISSTTLPASEFSSWVKQNVQTKTVVVALSQSGESVDALAAVRSAATAGMRTIGITNADQSSLAKQTEFQLFGRAGEEKALAATKSYTATLAAAYALVMELARSIVPDSENIELLERGLRNAADQMQLTLTLSEDQSRILASKFADRQLHFMLGSGPNYPTALEGALKLKECCNLYAEGFATREFLHGPMQLVDSRTPVFLLQGPNESEQVAQLAKSFIKFGAPTVVIKRKDEDIMAEGFDTIYVAPDIEELFSSLVYVIPLQLYAFYSALERGLNPDSPVKLTKVVK